LEAVARLSYPRFEILVVDNAPRDDKSREVAGRRGVRYILEPAPGLSRARNRGARACETEIVAFLDDDAIPEPDWLSALAAEFTDPLVMAVAGRVRPLSAETEAERLGALVAGLDAFGAERRTVDSNTASWFEIANFGGIGTGGNMAFRRRAFDTWTGFDERLGCGAPLEGSEEHYAFFKLIDLGYRAVYTPHAVVRHPCPQTMEQLRARHAQMLTSAAGYMTLLFVEEPRYRWAALKYAVEALKGSGRPWRAPAAAYQPRLIPRWRALLAYLSGPIRYVQACLGHM
jgi:cellulose synthase/poly-beta-1,6-N-acetylglucosamine synthase-like glycosyltransferase